MNTLDDFYNRSFEKVINNKMLYYNYEFPWGEVKAYIRDMLSIPVKDYIDYDILLETKESITPKDVFQFSNLEACTSKICHVLAEAGNPGVKFAQAGELLLNDGKKRKETAYIKYGENQLKTATALGLLYELSNTYFLSCIGIYYERLSADDQKKLVTRLFLRSKLIARLIKASSLATVDARQFLYMLSESTYIRRKTNLKHVLKFLNSSDEFDFSDIINHISFP